ncbi:MAG: dethiobiotin synthase [Myxococcaceae bacterium]|nr:dethiobiotin synthase [Myxococcaceae bacterium]
MSPPRFFVTGTDTGIGKTEVSLALLSLMRKRGLEPFALKPYQSGGGDDAKRLGARVLYRFKEPLAPGVAAELEGVKPSMKTVLKAIPREGAGVVEGAGGLFVPLDAKHDVIDLIRATKLPVVLVARLGLGTLNHTAMSLGALRGTRVAAVVLVKSTKGQDASEPHNPTWLERRHPGVRFLGPVPFIANEGRRLIAFERVLKPLVP